MMRILGLLGKVCQIVKRCLNYADFTGPITTAMVDPIPFIIYDDPNVKGSFLFVEESEESIVDSRESGVGSQESIGDKPQITANNKKQGANVNDELAIEYHPQPAIDKPRWLVNDDLAACTLIGNRQPAIGDGQSAIHNSQFTIHNTTTDNSSTKPISNDPGKSGSFISLFTGMFAEMRMKAKALAKVNSLVRRLVRQNANEGESIAAFAKLRLPQSEGGLIKNISEKIIAMMNSSLNNKKVFMRKSLENFSPAYLPIKHFNMKKNCTQNHS